MITTSFILKNVCPHGNYNVNNKLTNSYLCVQTVVSDEKTPCQPSPCGPNSQCKVVNGQEVCSCLVDYIGTPPNCRPECTISSECPPNKACVNLKCKVPCPGSCGLQSKCEVINHSPICSCSPGHTGDPFTRCYPIPRK